MALLRCVQDTGLLAEKRVALVDDVLDDLRAGTPVLNSKRAIRVEAPKWRLISTSIFLVIELRHAFLTISPMRRLVPQLIDTEITITRLYAMDII